MYEENELENYAKYMTYIRKAIIEETNELGLIVKEKDIAIGHIDKLAVCKLDDMTSCTWGFQYTVKSNQRFDMVSGKKKTIMTKEMRYTQQICFDEWQRLMKVETRNAIIDRVLAGLEPKHKETLVEGLKNNDLK